MLNPLSSIGQDCIRLFCHAPGADCRPVPGGWIALSGERGIADLNMAGLTRAATRASLDTVLAAIRDSGVDTLLLIDADAEEARGWATAAGLPEVGGVPVMERIAAPVDAPGGLNVRRALADEAGVAARLAAEAFALDRDACTRALPPATFADGRVTLWLAEDDSGPCGCGIFVQGDSHVGIYTMATPPSQQRRGVGRAVLAAGMAHYRALGATRFLLAATEVGFPLYQRVGFEVIAEPRVFVVGQSTQFPGG